MIDKILVLIKKFLLNVFNNHFKSLEHKIKYEILTSNLQDKAMNSVNSGISDEKYCENDIIISLTSYASRVQTVHLTIESLLNQTIKPNKIILWLRFPDGIPTAFSEAVTAMVTDVFNTYEFEPVIPETVTEEVVTETTEEVTNDTENT